MDQNFILISLFLVIAVSGCIDNNGGNFLQDFNETDHLEFSSDNINLTADKSSETYNASMKLPYDREEMTERSGSSDDILNIYATQYCRAFQQQFFTDRNQGNLELKSDYKNVTVTNIENGEILNASYPLAKSETFKLMQDYTPKNITLKFYDQETGNTTHTCIVTGTSSEDIETDFEQTKSPF